MFPNQDIGSDRFDRSVGSDATNQTLETLENKECRLVSESNVYDLQSNKKLKSKSKLYSVRVFGVFTALRASSLESLESFDANRS